MDSKTLTQKENTQPQSQFSENVYKKLESTGVLNQIRVRFSLNYQF